MGHGRSLAKHLAVTTLLAMTACTSPQGRAPTTSPTSAGGASPSPTASASPTTAPRPDSPGQARLEGRYVVKFVVLESTFGGKLTTRPAKLRITPKCKQGPCDVVMDGHIEEDAFSVRLADAGKGVYGGVVKGDFATCNGASTTDTWTFKITPSKMELIADEWIVTKWEGRWERSALEGPCLPGTERSLMRATRV